MSLLFPLMRLLNLRVVHKLPIQMNGAQNEIWFLMWNPYQNQLYAWMRFLKIPFTATVICCRSFACNSPVKICSMGVSCVFTLTTSLNWVVCSIKKDGIIQLGMRSFFFEKMNESDFCSPSSATRRGGSLRLHSHMADWLQKYLPLPTIVCVSILNSTCKYLHYPAITNTMDNMVPSCTVHLPWHMQSTSPAPSWVIRPQISSYILKALHPVQDDPNKESSSNRPLCSYISQSMLGVILLLNGELQAVQLLSIHIFH